MRCCEVLLITVFQISVYHSVFTLSEENPAPTDQWMLTSAEEGRSVPPPDQIEKCINNVANIWPHLRTKDQCIPKVPKVRLQSKMLPDYDVEALDATDYFIKQGYDPIGVPSDLDHCVLMILPDVLFEFKADSFGNSLALSFGSSADVHQAKFNKTQDVVVKDFKSATLGSITEAGMIMTYLHPIVPIPKFLGLVRHIQKVGLVSEFIPNAERLSDILVKKNMTASQLRSIVIQIVDAVHRVHQQYVLINDLLASNILVRFVDAKPVVKLVDFAQATFKYGAMYTSSAKLDPFVAPELIQTHATTPATDVYSLGDILRRINRRLRSAILNRVVILCMNEDPSQRPSAREVNFLISVFLENTKIPSNRKISAMKTRSSPVPYLFDRLDMQQPLPFMSHTSLLSVRDPKGKKVWLRKGFVKVFIAELHSRLVVVKNTGADFEFTRQEALILQMMNDTETIPHFYGLVAIRQDLNSFSLVSDMFGNGITVYEIVKNIAKLSLEFQVLLVTRMFDIVQTFHNRGLLINNIAIDNFIIADNKTDPQIRIVGLHSVSGVDGILPDQVLDDLLTLTTIAPEVKLTRRTSVRTDWYSIGHVLLELQLDDALTLQSVLLYRDCIDKDVSHCPDLMEVKNIFLKLLESSKDVNKST